MSQQLDLSLETRYHTIWPVFITRTAWTLSAQCARFCAVGRARWQRVLSATLLAAVPVALIVVLWAVLISLVVVWPLAWLAMLPTRVAVRRDVTQRHAIYACCWAGIVIWPAWWAALVLAYRDPPEPGLHAISSAE